MRVTITAASLFAAALAVPAVQYGGEAYPSSSSSSSSVYYASSSSTTAPVVYGTSSVYSKSTSSVYSASSSSSSSCTTSTSTYYPVKSTSSVPYYPVSSVYHSYPAVKPSVGYSSSVYEHGAPYPTSGVAYPTGGKPGKTYPTGTGSATYPTKTGVYTGAGSSVQAAGLLAGAGAVAALFL